MISLTLKEKPVSVDLGVDIRGLAASQAAHKLGNPQLPADHSALIGKMDSLGFPLVEKPRTMLISTDANSNREDVTFLPRVAFIKLEPSTRRTTVWKRGKGWFYSDIPLIPMAVQELSKRAREQAGISNFYLLYEVNNWTHDKEATEKTRILQRDPFLLGEKDGCWFEIAGWDGDQDLLRTTFEPRAQVKKSFWQRVFNK